MIIPAQLRAHLESPDHGAVIGPRLQAWVRIHTHLHQHPNRGWRSQGLISNPRQTEHERTQPFDHSLPEEAITCR